MFVLHNFQINNIVIIQPASGNMVMPASTFCSTSSLTSKPIEKLPETPTLPVKENRQFKMSKNESSSQALMSEKKLTVQDTSDTEANKGTSEDKTRSDPGSSTGNVRVEYAPTCEGIVASPHTEQEEASEDLSVGHTQDMDKTMEDKSIAQSQSLISGSKDTEFAASEGEWDGNSVDSSEAAGSANTRAEEGKETVIHREDNAVTDDEMQLQESHRQVNGTKSVINTQSDSILDSGAVNSEFVCGSQTNHGNEKSEGTGTENLSLPQVSQASPVSLCASSPPCTPEKLSPAATPLMSQHLYLCTPFATPYKPEEQTSSCTSHSTSPLSTPILSVPSPVASPGEALQGLRQRNLTAELETSDELPRTSANLVKSMPFSQGQSISEVTDKVKGKATTPLRRVTESPIIDRTGALVTSVYEAPVLTKEKGERSLRLINITPSKPETRHRKISPAKTLRSPIKTSPLKQVSPILRKYHKYSPKKRHIRSGKLLPILPKITVSKRQYITNCNQK